MSNESATELKAALEAALERHADAFLRDFQRIIQFPTVSGGTAAEEADYRKNIPLCLAWLEERARALGFSFKSWKGKIAEIEWAVPSTNGLRRPVLGIAAHIDVVTAQGAWTHPPFSGAIADGFIWGRGTQDDKGPLIQALYGMYIAKEAGVVPACDVRLIIGTSEETGDWSDVELYREVRGCPDYGYTPDADFPIINGEKGMLNLLFSAKWPAVGPHAETQMQFVSMAGGVRSNIVPGLCEAKLQFPADKKHDVMKELVRETTRFTVEQPGANVTMVPSNDAALAAAGRYETLVTFLGKAAHSSTPEQGHNAIVDAMRFFSDIETLPAPVRAFIQFLALVGSDSSGENLQIAGEHDYIGKTTINLALTEIGREGGTAVINVRPTMGMTCATVLERARLAAQAFTDAVGLEIEVATDDHAVDAIFLDPGQLGTGQFLATLLEAYRVATGREEKPFAIGGTTYAKAFPNFCAYGPILPGVDPELAHQADERFALTSATRNVLIYGMSVALMGK